MYKVSDLVKEIREVIDARIKRGDLIHPDWVTQQVMVAHPEPLGDESDFYLCMARETVRDQVRKQIGRYKLSPEKALIKDRETLLPGFEHLQQAYLIDVQGEQIAVPLKQMNSAQRRAKIDELRAMGAGCYQHASELERYDDEHPFEHAA
ncbi:MAG: hypothetical protein U1F68_14925 [Gammaproteobacteria bacterium]